MSSFLLEQIMNDMYQLSHLEDGELATGTLLHLTSFLAESDEYKLSPNLTKLYHHFSGDTKNTPFEFAQKTLSITKID